MPCIVPPVVLPRHGALSRDFPPKTPPAAGMEAACEWRFSCAFCPPVHEWVSRKAGSDYTTIMKASGHVTMSMFFRYNLVGEEDVANMKWKEQADPDDAGDDIRAKLIQAGMDPEAVRVALLENPESASQNR